MEDGVPFLLSNGHIALVDQEMTDRLRKFSWFGHATSKGVVYAKGYVPERFGGKGRHTFMHRWIMRAPKDYEVDHINGDTLDNRISNLQIVTRSRNMMKGRLAERGGVSYSQRHQRWIAKIRVDGKRYYLGSFRTREEAQASVNLHRLVAWAEPEINALGAERGNVS